MYRQLSSGWCLHTNEPRGWTINTVCIWQSWFQRVHKGWTTTAFHTKQSHLSLKDRQRSQSVVGVETESNLQVCLAETLDHLSTVWHLVDACPTVLLEDIKANYNVPRWRSFQAFLIPDTSPPTYCGQLPFYPQSPTNPADVVEPSVQYGIYAFLQFFFSIFTIITCDHAI